MLRAGAHHAKAFWTNIATGDEEVVQKGLGSVESLAHDPA
jgi:hypothetical protein